MNKYIIEFIGTFFLVLIIGLTSNPIAIGLGLAVLVYMGAHISGAHYNPAVSLAMLINKKLSPKENLSVLDGLKQSKLFRPDQYSYILYPFKNLKGFMDRNTIPSQDVNDSKLLTTLVSDGNARILEKDIKTHGATVHTVTSELDSGKILGQVTINILKKDTPKNLASKLIIKEHKLYTKVIRNIITGKKTIIQEN